MIQEEEVKELLNFLNSNRKDVVLACLQSISQILSDEKVLNILICGYSIDGNNQNTSITDNYDIQNNNNDNDNNGKPSSHCINDVNKKELTPIQFIFQKSLRFSLKVPEAKLITLTLLLQLSGLLTSPQLESVMDRIPIIEYLTTLLEENIKDLVYRGVWLNSSPPTICELTLMLISNLTRTSLGRSHYVAVSAPLTLFLLLIYADHEGENRPSEKCQEFAGSILVNITIDQKGRQILQDARASLRTSFLQDRLQDSLREVEYYTGSADSKYVDSLGVGESVAVGLSLVRGKKFKENGITSSLTTLRLLKNCVSEVLEETEIIRIIPIVLRYLSSPDGTNPGMVAEPSLRSLMADIIHQTLLRAPDNAKLKHVISQSVGIWDECEDEPNIREKLELVKEIVV